MDWESEVQQPSDDDLRRWHIEWTNGRSKNEIERDELGRPEPHGKLITELWRERLGLETEEEHPLVVENRRLRSLLEENGIDPSPG